MIWSIILLCCCRLGIDVAEASVAVLLGIVQVELGVGVECHEGGWNLQDRTRPELESGIVWPPSYLVGQTSIEYEG